jgi:signal transduction histidine kinase
VGTAIRTGKPSLCSNTLTDPNFAVWRESARKHGYGSVLALPLAADQRCFGALAIYAPKPDAFDAGEQQLLLDLANDLAFGISNLRLRAERERLEDEILRSIEREQERIGRDLHDGLCQLLVGAKFRSVYLQKISGSPPAVQEARALEEMLNHAIEQTRNLARGLNPVKVTPAGLVAALQKLAADVESAHQVHCFCQLPDTVELSQHHAAYHLYLIAQEAVQNALKHSGAKSISIALAQSAGRLVLTVRDDGTGISPTRPPAGMGLNNMRARAKLIGGSLEICGREAGGTTISCELPAAPNHHETSQQKTLGARQTPDLSGG